MPLFDICVITASAEKQANGFRTLIARRVERGLYPREIDFRVYADPPGGAHPAVFPPTVLKTGGHA